MRLIRPALIFVALAAGVACQHPASAPAIPAAARPASTPAARPSWHAHGVRLLRRQLERQTDRMRVRLPGAAQISLVPSAQRGVLHFRCRYDVYVPASSLPWVFEATGRVDMIHNHVILDRLLSSSKPEMDQLAWAGKPPSRLADGGDGSSRPIGATPPQ
ncbi:MAG: hypothetical protein VKP62_13580 [Candidatus Sericytochromatia bacterium]|nr:hypothetical protein [Candidatus Sericytochromatia bacterium]